MNELIEYIVESFLTVIIVVSIFVVIVSIIGLFLVIDAWLYNRSGGGYVGFRDKIHNSQWIFRGICLFLVLWFFAFMILMTEG